MGPFGWSARPVQHPMDPAPISGTEGWLLLAMMPSMYKHQSQTIDPHKKSLASQTTGRRKVQIVIQ